MPSVIDTLIVELALDPTKFTAAQAQAVAVARQATQQLLAQAQQVQAAGQQMGHYFTELKKQAIEFIAALFGARAIKDFIVDMTLVNAALGRSAHVLNVSASELAAWQGVARATGGSAESMTGSLQGLSDQIQRGLVTGEWGNLLRVFNRFGISVKDANGHLKTSGDLLLELNEKFSRMDPARARVLLQLLGLDPATIDAILMNTAALRGLVNQEREIAGNMEPATRAAADLQKAWNLTADAAKRLGTYILTWLSPNVLTPGLNVIGAILRAYDRVFGAIQADTLQGAAARRRGGEQSNMASFLAGLSFLESPTGAPSATSSARGFFQFTKTTAEQSIAAGLGDPRVGTYQEQATITQAFIEKFHPDAAAAIRRGDFIAAAAMLNQRWPSLPGGSQPQSLAQYRRFGEIIHRGDRPTGAGAANVTNTTVGGDTTSTSTTVHINGPINIHTESGADADATARSIGPAIKRTAIGIPLNTGPQ